MNGSVAYLDTSAFVKLIAPEAETPSLIAALARWSIHVSAMLLRTEAVRALRRAGNGALTGQARRAMEGLMLVELSQTLLDRASDLDPDGLRSLDAIHLAAALSLGPDLGVLIAYDRRLRDAATAQGITVAAPGEA
jgi:predicted nucleic acid-binding protein